MPRRQRRHLLIVGCRMLRRSTGWNGRGRTLPQPSQICQEPCLHQASAILARPYRWARRPRAAKASGQAPSSRSLRCSASSRGRGRRLSVGPSSGPAEAPACRSQAPPRQGRPELELAAGEGRASVPERSCAARSRAQRRGRWQGLPGCRSPPQRPRPSASSSCLAPPRISPRQARGALSMSS